MASINPVATYNLTIVQGATLSLGFALAQSAVPLDLTGYTVRAQVRPYIASSVVLAEWSIASGHVTLDPLTGSFALEVPADETAAIAQSGAWDLEIEAPDGFVTRLVEGTAKLKPEVTR